MLYKINIIVYFSSLCVCSSHFKYVISKKVYWRSLEVDKIDGLKKGHTDFMNVCVLKLIQAHIYCAWQVLHFHKLKVLWQPCIEQVYQHRFSNRMCSLPVSLSHFGDPHSISELFIIIISVTVISDLWCYCCNCFEMLETMPI